MMKKIISLIVLICIALVSCNENVEKHYESNQVKIIYKENNSISSEKKIKLDFASKDTVLLSNGFNFKTINGLFDATVKTKNDHLKFTSSDKFDFILIKKDTSLTSNSIYKEFELFLLKEKIAKKITK
jgi:hypothetical protein